MPNHVASHEPWWAGEQHIYLSDLPNFLPRHRRGRRIHVASIYRWAKSGLRGIRLRSFLAGGRLATTRQELDRFFSRLTDKSYGLGSDGVSAELRQRGLS